MPLKSLLILAVSLLVTTAVHSQYRATKDLYNRLGLQGGITFTEISGNTINFKPGQGYTAGFTTRANTRRNISVIYGVNFYRFNSTVDAQEETPGVPSEIDFKATGVQINLFIGRKLLGEHLSIEAGPVLQINSKWDPEEGQEDRRLKNYTILAGDIADVAKINANAAVNLSTGFKSLKFWLQYQYGLTNILRNLDVEELQNKDSRLTDLKGRMRMATAGMVFYF